MVVSIFICFDLNILQNYWTDFLPLVFFNGQYFLEKVCVALKMCDFY